MRLLRALLATALLVGLVAAPPSFAQGGEPAAADDATSGWSFDVFASLSEAGAGEVFAKWFDAQVLRPLGLLQTVIGVALLPPSYALAYPGGAHEEVLDIMVKSPAEYTFGRPLGDF